MKITLKNFKHAAFQSQETECFNADVYVDGVKACTAENSGCGGSTFLRPLYCESVPAVAVKSRELMVKAETYAETLPEIPYGYGMEGSFAQSLEWLVDAQVSILLTLKDRKKVAAKGVAFIFGDNDEDITYYSFPRGYNAAQKEVLREKWIPEILKKNPTARFINKDGTIRGES